MRLARLLTFAPPAILLLTLLAPPVPTASADSPVKTLYSISLLGQPKYPQDFKHFDYVNPDAPKGGEIKRAAIGSFDSFNPFIIKGNPAVGAAGLLFDTLLTPSQDEADASYGLLAESIELPDDHSWVAYNLRPEAKFQDGTPVTAEDVVFSFDMLTTKGDPQWALYYADVAKAEAGAPLKVKFIFKTSANRELPVILGQLPVLPKHYWQGKTFDETTLTRNLRPLIESGWVAIGTGEDRREKLVCLTEAGAAKLRQARPAWERAQERMRSRLPDGAWSGLLAALPELARLADEA